MRLIVAALAAALLASAASQAHVHTVTKGGLRLLPPGGADYTVSISLVWSGFGPHTAAGGTLVGKLVYVDRDYGYEHLCEPACKYACSSFVESQPMLELTRGENYIMLIERGPGENPCLYTEKVWNAQGAGAVGAVIINYFDSLGLIEQAPDAIPRDITVPSALITKSSGDLLKALLRTGHEVRVLLDWRDPAQREAEEAGQLVAGSCEAGGGTCGGQAASTPAPAPAPAPAAAPSQEEGSDWYTLSRQYWEAKPATEEGMLGFDVGKQDLKDSQQFLLQAFGAALEEAKAASRRLVALDCACGIGRVSENLLLHYFQEVDLFDHAEHLLETARQRLAGGGGSRPFPSGHRAVNFYRVGLQDFIPEPQRYDVVWGHWVLVYLTDEDAVKFLRRAAEGLRPGGMIFIKENIATHLSTVTVESVRQIVRPAAALLRIFKQAGLARVQGAVQSNWPPNLYPVYMYALAREEAP